jgi:hypothetical protein
LKPRAKPLPVNFPLTLPLRYKGRFEYANIRGAACTKWIGSKEIAFAAGDDIREHMRAEIAVAWPFLLDDRVRLQLTIDAVVTQIADGVAFARISNYQFRTRADWEASDDAAPLPVRVASAAASA